MSGLSPSRVRTKTSELADFFRGQPSRHIQHEPVEGPQTQSTLLTVPQAQESSMKKMTTRIPFLGRTRKKSTHPTKSGGLLSSSRGYDSEVAESSASKKDRRLSHPVPSPEPASRHPPLPAALPQINVASPSLGSKFVAHFSHVKSRKAAPSPRSSQAGPSEGSTSDTLSPPMTPRAASFDSASTSASANSPSTPRPTITVSPSPDNMEDYKDLFTLPRHKKSAASRRQPSTPASEYRDNYHKTESSVTLTPSTPNSPRTNQSVPAHNRRASSSSRSEAKDWESRRLADSSRSSKIAKKRITSTRRPEDSTPDDSTEESMRQVRSAESSAPVFDDTPPPPPSKASSPVPRSRLRAVSSAKDRASTPPSIPLPAPPNTRMPVFASTTSIPSKLATPTSSAKTLMRPRANTIGSVPLPPQTAATIIIARPSSPKRTVKLSNENPNVAAKKSSSYKENSDLDAMTPKQLKQALVTRNNQYDELAAHFLEVTQNLAAEKSALEKKIALLEAEAARRDKEIQGFTWMLNNRGGGAPADNGESYTQIPGPRAHRSPSMASSKLSSRRFQYTDDSGAESHATSGAESVRGSGASESSMSGRMKKGLRPLTLGESTSYSIYRSSMSNKSSAAGRGPAVDSGVSDYSQRTSVYSVSSSTTSATSSASSLMPPSPGIPVSSLSAIPEAGTMSSSKVGRISVSPTRDSLSASEWETDDKRSAQRAARRISTSSFSSSSSGATSAYSANLRRGRPPSIAQVLQKSPTMDEVLEKLRPFAGSHTAYT
ncbi:hypothetical protein D9615_003242 [Tricholomella constricta]|uniref:Uncharacterized protein n=1 Tax=Tricholomella constricta TaxID=117010 RepID=A0A8H5HIV7_9AGAR|nr:hypothetical protein D9615_003242 [Tricholomella constricta]